MRRVCRSRAKSEKKTKLNRSALSVFQITVVCELLVRVVLFWFVVLLCVLNRIDL
jgi:hypothetical protein